MLAWTIDHSETSHLALRSAPEPRPSAHEAVIAVHAFAPNQADVDSLPGMPDGTIPGWDASGVVVAAAADGTGPKSGERVISLGLTGAWAERRAAPSELIGIAPADGDLPRLSTLPIAATSALRALRRLGPILGRRVLVVGGNSSTGQFAIQLAARGGAHVIATTRDKSTRERLNALGAAEIIESPANLHEGVFGVIDLLGGRHLVEAFQHVTLDGKLVAVGHAAHEEEHFPWGAFQGSGPKHNRSITTFFLGSEGDLSQDMTWLATEASFGRLQTGPLTVSAWHDLVDNMATANTYGIKRVYTIGT